MKRRAAKPRAEGQPPLTGNLATDSVLWQLGQVLAEIARNGERDAAEASKEWLESEAARSQAGQGQPQGEANKS